MRKFKAGNITTAEERGTKVAAKAATKEAAKAKANTKVDAECACGRRSDTVVFT